jgi:hypothetical protein
VPRHVGQGSSITVPLPRQRGHGCESAKKPWLSETTPRPLHCGQIRGAVPGFAPEPPQVWHAVSTSTGTRTVTPFSASSKESRTSTSTSAPRSGTGPRAPPPRPPRLKIPPKRSPRSKSAWKPPVVARGPAAPKVSNCLRFSGSESTSYAACTSLKRSSAAASPGFRSGWCSRTSFRYAFLISSCEAFLATPSVS